MGVLGVLGFLGFLGFLERERERESFLKVSGWEVKLLLHVPLNQAASSIKFGPIDIYELAWVKILSLLPQAKVYGQIVK